jgi:hypothetical protein
MISTAKNRNVLVQGAAGGGGITALTGDVTATGPGSAAATLANSGVSAGTKGSATKAPVITVDAKGRVTALTEATITDTGITQLTGDVTAGPGSGSQAATLSTTGATAGTFGSATKTPVITVDAKGRITASSEVTITDTGITQLTGDVTAGPGSGSQASTLAATAVTPGTYGSVVKNVTFTVDSKGRLTAASEDTATSVVTSTGNIDDLNFSNAKIIFMNNASDATIRGLVAGSDGQQVTIISKGAGNVYLAHQNTNSSANNRLINFVTSGNTPLAAGSGVAIYTYDGTTLRWRLSYQSQGSWLTPAFNAGDFTGNGSMTITLPLGAGNVAVFKYFISGKAMTVSIGLNGLTIGGTPNTLIQIAIPLSMSAASQIEALGRAGNNAATGTTVGLIVTVPSLDATKIFYANTPLANVNWALSTANSNAFGTLTFDLV